MDIRIVNPVEWIPQIGDLLAANWAETGFDFPFDPDIDTYQRLWDMNLLFAVAAFDGDKVVGYCTVIVNRHPHNPSVIVAANDALFVDPAYRRGTATGRIMRAVEEEAKWRGAARMSWHCRPGTPLASMLEGHGYIPVDTIVMKEI